MANEPLLRVRGLCHRYVRRQPITGKISRVQVLQDLDLTIARGSTVALVGQSGSGKSTLARCLMRLEEPDAGEIWFEGKNLLTLSRQELFSVRRGIQLVLQDPVSAFNPRFSAAEIIAEPLLIHQWGTKAQRRERVLLLMEQVGLPREWAGRLSLNFSGGQRQRLAIARALALEPRFLILDEALSALDLSIQAQIANLLLELQLKHSLTYLLITHDLALAGHLADEIAVLYGGRVVEHARTANLFTNPQHPESQELLASTSVVHTGLASPLC